MSQASVSLSKAGTSHFAVIDGGPKLFVGKEVSYQGRRGLQNLGSAGSSRYDPDDYRDQHGFWADFIAPTAQCESGGVFCCLNTYDRAAFTFGFLQFAAHVPDGDCINFFHELLALPAAAHYFPDLSLIAGRIHKHAAGAAQCLETAKDTTEFMGYFKPVQEQVSPEEVRRAALCLHWCENALESRNLQVAVGIRLFRNNMLLYADKYGLDGAPDFICCILADIRHQGRASSTKIRTALDTGGDWVQARKQLLALGAADYPARIAALNNSLDDLEQKGIFGRHVYDLASADFIRRPVAGFA
jgi:hypothetical protein